MKAKLLERSKSILSDYSIVEVAIWQVPAPVPGSQHGYQYSLYFGRAGNRLVGFDNERGKGDHMHLDGVECAYDFTTIEQLMMDFLAEIEKRRSQT